jgi:hypothetical protein
VSRDAALAYLHDWAREAGDPDPEQRAWKIAFAEGAITAYERVGVLDPDEARRWRERSAPGPGHAGAPHVEAAARAAAERYLEELLAKVVPRRREPAPEDVEASEDCSAAIEALTAAGALDAERSYRWRKRQLEAEAPWLEDPEPARPGTAQLILVPPENEEQALEDAAAEALHAALPTATEARRVFTGTPERHDGLAIVALVAYDDCAELHFHYVDENFASGQSGIEAFSRAFGDLPKPVLGDDQGTRYERTRSGSAGGRGGAIGGSWRYVPAPPAGVTGFTATAAEGGHTWRLG